MTHKDAPNIVDHHGNQPSTIIMDCSPQASQDDLKDGERPLPDVSPLPTLEPATAEKKQLYPEKEEDRTAQSAVSPLPGTRVSVNIENAGKSSNRRSPKRVCNTGLLHNSCRHPSITISNGVIKSGADCLSIYRAKCERSMSINRRLSIAF